MTRRCVHTDDVQCAHFVALIGMVDRHWGQSLVVGAPAGQLLSIGENTRGQLGNGTTTDASTVVPVTGQHSAIAVAVGALTSYALDADGSESCLDASSVNAMP